MKALKHVVLKFPKFFFKVLSRSHEYAGHAVSYHCPTSYRWSDLSRPRRRIHELQFPFDWNHDTGVRFHRPIHTKSQTGDDPRGATAVPRAAVSTIEECVYDFKQSKNWRSGLKTKPVCSSSSFCRDFILKCRCAEQCDAVWLCTWKVIAHLWHRRYEGSEGLLGQAYDCALPSLSFFRFNGSVLKGRRVQSVEVPTVKLNKACGLGTWKEIAHMSGISATISVTRANKNG